MPPKPIILAFDTAAAHCAAVVVQGRKTLAARVEPMQKGQAERLFLLLEEILEESEKKWADLDCIAVGTGPGNFTGIRISVSAARGLALSLNIPSIGVSRLEAMAFETQGQQAAVIDARQNRIYTQSFSNGTATDDVALHAVADFVPPSPLLSDGEVNLPTSTISTTQVLQNAAIIASTQMQTEHPKPAPLYVRAPDAALPSDPPPTILP